MPSVQAEQYEGFEENSAAEEPLTLERTHFSDQAQHVLADPRNRPAGFSEADMRQFIQDTVQQSLAEGSHQPLRSLVVPGHEGTTVWISSTADGLVDDYWLEGPEPIGSGERIADELLKWAVSRVPSPVIMGTGAREEAQRDAVREVQQHLIHRRHEFIDNAAAAARARKLLAPKLAALGVELPPGLRGGGQAKSVPLPVSALDTDTTGGSRETHTVYFAPGSKKLVDHQLTKIEQLGAELADLTLANRRAGLPAPEVEITGLGNSKYSDAAAQRATAVEQALRASIEKHLKGHPDNLLPLKAADLRITHRPAAETGSGPKKELRRAEITVHRIPQPVYLGDTGGQHTVPVTKSLYMVWVGTKELSPSAKENITAWQAKTAEAGWELVFFADAVSLETNHAFFQELRSLGKVRIEPTKEYFETAASKTGQRDLVERARILHEYALSRNAFAMASDVLRYLALWLEGGVYADVDLAPGAVSLPSDGLSMAPLAIPFMAPQLQDWADYRDTLQDADAWLKGQAAPDSPQKLGPLRKIAEYKYLKGNLGNNFLVTPAGSRFMAQVLRHLPETAELDGLPTDDELNRNTGAKTGPGFLYKKMVTYLRDEGHLPPANSVYDAHLFHLGRLQPDPAQMKQWHETLWLTAESDSLTYRTQGPSDSGAQLSDDDRRWAEEQVGKAIATTGHAPALQRLVDQAIDAVARKRPGMTPSEIDNTLAEHGLTPAGPWPKNSTATPLSSEAITWAQSQARLRPVIDEPGRSDAGRTVTAENIRQRTAQHAVLTEIARQRRTLEHKPDALKHRIAELLAAHNLKPSGGPIGGLPTKQQPFPENPTPVASTSGKDKGKGRATARDLAFRQTEQPSAASYSAPLRDILNDVLMDESSVPARLPAESDTMDVDVDVHADEPVTETGNPAQTPSSSASASAQVDSGDRVPGVRETISATFEEGTYRDALRWLVTEAADRLTSLEESTWRRNTPLPVVEVTVFGDTGPLPVKGSGETHTSRTLASEIADRLSAELEMMLGDYAKRIRISLARPPQSTGPFTAEVSLILPGVTDSFTGRDRTLPVTTPMGEHLTVVLDNIDHRRMVFSQEGRTEYRAGRLLLPPNPAISNSWRISHLDIGRKYFPHVVSTRDASGYWSTTTIAWGTVPWDRNRPTYVIAVHANPHWLSLSLQDSQGPQTVSVPGSAVGRLVKARDSAENLKKLGRTQLVMVACKAGADVAEPGVNAAQEIADESGMETWASTALVTSLPRTGRRKGTPLGLESTDDRYGEWKRFIPTAWKKITHPSYPQDEASFQELESLLRGGSAPGDPLERWQEAAWLWREELEPALRDQLFSAQETFPRLPSDATQGLPEGTQVPPGRTPDPTLWRTRDLALWIRDRIGALEEQLRGVRQSLSDAEVLTGTGADPVLTGELHLMDESLAAMRRDIVGTLLPRWDHQLSDKHDAPWSSADLKTHVQEDYPGEERLPSLASLLKDPEPAHDQAEDGQQRDGIPRLAPVRTGSEQETPASEQSAHYSRQETHGPGHVPGQARELLTDEELTDDSASVEVYEEGQEEDEDERFPLGDALDPRPTWNELAAGDLTRARAALRQLRVHYATWLQSLAPEDQRQPYTWLSDGPEVSYRLRKQQLDAFLATYLPLIQGILANGYGNAVRSLMAGLVGPWVQNDPTERFERTEPSVTDGVSVPDLLAEVRDQGALSPAALTRLTRPWLPADETFWGEQGTVRARAASRVSQYLRLAGETHEGAPRFVPVETLVKALLLSGLPLPGKSDPVVLPDGEMFRRHRDLLGGDAAVRAATLAAEATAYFRQYLDGHLDTGKFVGFFLDAAAELTGEQWQDAPGALPDAVVEVARGLFHELHQYFQATASLPYLTGESDPTAVVEADGPVFAYHTAGNGGRSLARTDGTAPRFRYEGAYEERFAAAAEVFATPQTLRERYGDVVERRRATDEWSAGWLFSDDPLLRLQDNYRPSQQDHARYLRFRAKYGAAALTSGQWELFRRLAESEPSTGNVLDTVRELAAVYSLATGDVPADFRQQLADRELSALVTAALADSGLRLLPTSTGTVRQRVVMTEFPPTVGQELELDLTVGGVGTPHGTGNVEFVYAAFPYVSASPLFGDTPNTTAILPSGTRGVVTSIESAPELSTPNAPGYRLRVVPAGVEYQPFTVKPPTPEIAKGLGWLGPSPYQHFEVRRRLLGDGTKLSRLTVRVYLNVQPGVTPEQVAETQKAATEVLRSRHNLGYRFRNGELVEFALEFTADQSSAHRVVELRPGSGHPNSMTWYAGMELITLLHEISHLFGGRDQYQRGMPLRPLDEDGSIMSVQMTDLTGAIHLNADYLPTVGPEVPNQRWMSYDLYMIGEAVQRALRQQPHGNLLTGPATVSEALPEVRPDGGPSKVTVPLDVRERVLWGNAAAPGLLAPRNGATWRETPQRTGAFNANGTYRAIRPSRAVKHGDPVTHLSGAGDLSLPVRRDGEVLMFPREMTEGEIIAAVELAYLDWLEKGGVWEEGAGQVTFEGIAHGLRLWGRADASGKVLDFGLHDHQVRAEGRELDAKPLQKPLYRSELLTPPLVDGPLLTSSTRAVTLDGNRSISGGAYHHYGAYTPIGDNPVDVQNTRGVQYVFQDPPLPNGVRPARVFLLKSTVSRFSAEADLPEAWQPIVDGTHGSHLIFPDWTADVLWGAVRSAHESALRSGQFTWAGADDNGVLGAGYLWVGEAKGVLIEGYVLENRVVWVRPAQRQRLFVWRQEDVERLAATRPRPVTLSCTTGEKTFHISHIVLENGDTGVALEARVELTVSPEDADRAVRRLRKIEEKVQQHVDETYNSVPRTTDMPLVHFEVRLIPRITETPEQYPDADSFTELLQIKPSPGVLAKEWLGFKLGREPRRTLRSFVAQLPPMPSLEAAGVWIEGDVALARQAYRNGTLLHLLTDPTAQPLLQAYAASEVAPYATVQSTIEYLLAQRKSAFSKEAGLTYLPPEEEQSQGQEPARKITDFTEPELRLLALRAVGQAQKDSPGRDVYSAPLPGTEGLTVPLSVQAQVDADGIIQRYQVVPTTQAGTWYEVPRTSTEVLAGVSEARTETAGQQTLGDGTGPHDQVSEPQVSLSQPLTEQQPTPDTTPLENTVDETPAPEESATPHYVKLSSAPTQKSGWMPPDMIGEMYQASFVLETVRAYVAHMAGTRGAWTVEDLVQGHTLLSKLDEAQRVGVVDEGLRLQLVAILEPVGSGPLGTSTLLNSTDEVRETYSLASTEKEELTGKKVELAIFQLAQRVIALGETTQQRGTDLPRVEVSVFGDTGPLTGDGSLEAPTAQDLAAKIIDLLRTSLREQGGEKAGAFVIDRVETPVTPGTFTVDVSLRLPGATDSFRDEHIELPLVTAVPGENATFQLRDLRHRRIHIRQTDGIPHAGREFHAVNDATDLYALTNLDISGSHFPHIVETPDGRIRPVGQAPVSWDPRRPKYVVMAHAQPGWLHVDVPKGEKPRTGSVRGGTLSVGLVRRPSMEWLLKQPVRPQNIISACNSGTTEQESGINSAQEIADATGLETWAGNSIVVAWRPTPDAPSVLGLLAKEDGQRGEWVRFIPKSWTKEGHPHYTRFAQNFASLTHRLRDVKDAGEESRRLADAAIDFWERLSKDVEERVLTRPLEAARFGLMPEKAHPTARPEVRRTRDFTGWANNELVDLNELLYKVQDALDPQPATSSQEDGSQQEEAQEDPLISRLEKMHEDVYHLWQRVYSTLSEWSDQVTELDRIDAPGRSLPPAPMEVDGGEPMDVDRDVPMVTETTETSETSDGGVAERSSALTFRAPAPRTEDTAPLTAPKQSAGSFRTANLDPKPLANLDAEPVAAKPSRLTAPPATAPQVTKGQVTEEPVTQETAGAVRQAPEVPLVNDSDKIQGRLQVTEWRGTGEDGRALGQLRYQFGRLDTASLPPGSPVTLFATGGEGGQPPRVLHLHGATWDDGPSDETEQIVRALLWRVRKIARGDDIDPGADLVLAQANAPVLTPELLGVYGFEQVKNGGGLWHAPAGVLIAAVKEQERPKELVVDNCETR
ncbi:glycosyltransferase [Streptomyces sp. NPDC002067]